MKRVLVFLLCMSCAVTYASPTHPDKVRISAFNENHNTVNNTGYDTWQGVNVHTTHDNFDFFAGIDRFNRSKNIKDDAVWIAGVNISTKAKFTLGGMYYRETRESAKNDGYVLHAEYAGADEKKVGSFGLNAKYFNQKTGTFNGYNFNPDILDVFKGEGFTGYGIGANYTLSKNVVLGIQYYDLQSKSKKEDSSKMLWSDMVFHF